VNYGGLLLSSAWVKLQITAMHKLVKKTVTGSLIVLVALATSLKVSWFILTDLTTSENVSKQDGSSASENLSVAMNTERS